MLTFIDDDKSKTCKVYLDNKYAGKIIEVNHNNAVAYQYFPKGSKTGGHVYSTKRKCRLSLYTPEELESEFL